MITVMTKSVLALYVCVYDHMKDILYLSWQFLVNQLT